MQTSYVYTATWCDYTPTRCDLQQLTVNTQPMHCVYTANTATHGVKTAHLTPCDTGDQYWGPSNVLQALYMYAEGQQSTSGDTAKFQQATRAVTGAVYTNVFLL